MSLEKKDFGFQIKALDKTGAFSGYGSLFDVEDSYCDIVRPGAFQASLKRSKKDGRMPAMLWQHQHSDPIGVWTKMQEDDKGLYVEGQLALDVRQGKEAYSLLKIGALNGLSIGFNTVKTLWDKEAERRELIEVNLWEVSIVTFPALSPARIDDVKHVSADTDLDDLADLRFALDLRSAALNLYQ